MQKMIQLLNKIPSEQHGFLFFVGIMVVSY